MKAVPKKLSRRSFLVTVGAGGAATAAALAARTPGAGSAPGGNRKRSARGYHATAHITKYYDTTKV